MAHIELCNITKRFKKITALDNISLDVKDKEFFVLFGPAGAGKTTILKTIAGVEFPDGGHVKMDGRIMNLIEPAKRNVSMVFENYALYPHISVYDNIASPMRSPLYKKDEEHIKKEVYRVASMMKIDHLMERLPSQLSNGQRQRVALGRCIVREPNVFLMDEPLAHLDAKLRHFMRAELKEMQCSFDTTTIYVTHDYLEAMSLGDRIGIINEGRIEQIGTSDEVYYTPANEFVAKLMGEPEVNIFKVNLINQNNRLKVKMLGQEKLFDIQEDAAKVLLKHHSNEVDLGIRGIDIDLSFSKKDDEYMHGTVYSLEPIGNKSVLIVDVNGQLIRLIAPNDLKADLDSDIFIKFNMNNALFFNCKDKTFLVRHRQEELAKGVA
ncbi:ABC transporter ATP-binding protein [Petroclostridium sp. X23]|uniref:ABC transporter ATP-binding protein n=1 Tax=Petroclostridium sp. X23 TaxID=3045146 RepID=UPI0024AD80EB|nr:ABC transporter ATP-binding protein [Petroclostridium sp. X23]WHH61118.1 ABC transporter ATP-binding protein [Petroclostridium sp. X23]